MIKFIKTIVLIVMAFCIASNVCAASPATGTITATQACQAYVSKNKLTNPDNTKLVINKNYPVIEANKAENPSWYRVRVSGANPVERWIPKHCGTFDVQTENSGSSGGQSGTQTNECQTAGLEDSYVLALSWQPAFCETHCDKPECRIEDKKSYQARNFTLHGLWPNKKSCGKDYGFCGEVQNTPGDFCDYPVLQLFSQTRQTLEQVMPSASAGSCLQRHEWFKHGTCQTKWSIDEYYETAIDLTHQFNESGIAYFFTRNTGKNVSEEEFISKVECALGNGTHNRIELKCSNGNLVDVYITLPADITPGQSLGELMGQGESRYKSNCGGSFHIDPIGVQ
ncbi:MAG: ribonuclease T [Proteobacteria bacterium]|nr:ribonuclease T [Pseudomonadota bacterium]